MIAGIASTMAVLLAAVFIAAALAKATAHDTTVAEFSQLGVPAPGIAARVVPLAELATAVTLLVAPRVGAVLATLILLAFTAVLVATVRSGRSVSCGCLGALSRRPVSATTVARNIVLIAMAGSVASTTTLSIPDAASVMTSISLLVMAGMAIQLLALRNTIGRIWSVDLAGEGTARSDRMTTDMKGIAT